MPYITCRKHPWVLKSPLQKVNFNFFNRRLIHDRMVDMADKSRTSFMEQQRQLRNCDAITAYRKWNAI